MKKNKVYTIDIFHATDVLSLPMKPHLEKAHAYWKGLLEGNETVIDATCGNGKDTQVLAELVPHGKVYSLDIQEKALIAARQSVSHSNVIFLHQSHINLPEESIKLVVYNLGYLPGGDKTITTMAKSTKTSLEKAAELINIGGALSITCYPGHPEGAVEEEAVAEWVQGLNSEKWDVIYHQWRIGSPTLFFIIKLKN